MVQKDFFNSIRSDYDLAFWAVKPAFASSGRASGSAWAQVVPILAARSIRLVTLSVELHADRFDDRRPAGNIFFNETTKRLRVRIYIRLEPRFDQLLLICPFS